MSGRGVLGRDHGVREAASGGAGVSEVAPSRLPTGPSALRGSLAFVQRRVNGQLSPYNVVLALGATIFLLPWRAWPMV